MSSTLQILQLNVRKQSMVQQSLMNDEQLREYGILAITEPYAWKEGAKLITSPMRHANWTKMIPTTQEESRWAVRSMLWVRKELEAEQVVVPSSDVTVVVLRLADRAVLVMLVYVPCNDAEVLRKTVGLLGRVINDVL